MQLQQKDKYSSNSHITTERKKLKSFFESKRKVTPILGGCIQANRYNQSDMQQQSGKIKDISQICESYCQQKVQIMKEINKYCQQKHKGLKTIVNDRIHAQIISQQFVFNEFFMPNCDQMYLSKNYMEDILKKCHFQSAIIRKDSQKQERVLQELKLPKLKEFKGIQQALPKPHLLSQQFIEQERNKMYQNRINSRTRNQNSTSIQKNIKFLTYQIQVGHEVWAYCPLCHLLHRGTVLSQYKDSYLVNFDQPLFGALKVPEHFITTKLGNSKYIQMSLLDQKKRGKNKIEKEQKINMSALSTYISLLEMKRDLLIKLRQFNTIAQNKKSQSPSSVCVSVLDENQIQQYGWIGTCINIITVAARYIENNYPIKLKDEQSDNHNLLGRQKSSKNSRLVMLALSDSYCNITTSANEQAEDNKYEKIKNIEKKEEMALNDQKLQHNELIDSDNSGCVQQSVRLSLGILKNLEKKGKNYRMQEDQNYKKLQQKYKNEYAGQIKEVYSKLKNIIQKLSH